MTMKPNGKGLWRCQGCRGIRSVLEYLSRVGVIRYAHCPICRGTTRQVLEGASLPGRTKQVV